MNQTAIKTIGKYALLLTVLYGLELLIGKYISYLTMSSSSYEMNSYLLSIPMISTYLLNIIAALILNMDKKRLKIEGKYSILLTLFYRPIGIVLFLIYVIDKELNEKSAHNSTCNQ